MSLKYLKVLENKCSNIRIGHKYTSLSGEIENTQEFMEKHTS
jgi:hypothetical protein